eukprot:1246396-Rhodomonas_salina.8
MLHDPVPPHPARRNLASIQRTRVRHMRANRQRILARDGSGLWSSGCAWFTALVALSQSECLSLCV